MNKKTIFNSIKIVALGIILGGAFSYMHTTFAAFPSSNTPALIDVGPEAQLILSSLGIGSLAEFDPVTSYGSYGSTFYGNVSVVGSPFPAAKNLYVTGKTGIGIAPTASSETLEVNGNVRLGAFDYSLSSPNSPKQQICADTNGKLIACPHGSYSSPGCTKTAPCTWTVPDGVFHVNISAIGGGGGGGAYPNSCGSGGGSGGSFLMSLNVTPGEQFYNIYAGPAGNPGVYGGAQPTGGGDSSISNSIGANYAFATGGGPGVNANAQTSGGAGGTPNGFTGHPGSPYGSYGDPYDCSIDTTAYGLGGGKTTLGQIGSTGAGGDGYGSHMGGHAGAVTITW